MNAIVGDMGRCKRGYSGRGEEERRGKERGEGKGTWKGLKTMRGGYRAWTRDRKKGYNMVDVEVEIAENVEVKLAKKWR